MSLREWFTMLCPATLTRDNVYLLVRAAYENGYREGYQQAKHDALYAEFDEPLCTNGGSKSYNSVTC